MSVGLTGSGGPQWAEDLWFVGAVTAWRGQGQQERAEGLVSSDSKSDQSERDAFPGRTRPIGWRETTWAS
jgi:hypothetical protein